MENNNEPPEEFWYEEPETPEEAQEHMEYMILEDNHIKEFKAREKSVQDGYIINFLPYGDGKLSIGDGCNGVSFGDIDIDILIKACQNDIRMALKKFGDGYTGEIKINYKNGKPEYLTVCIESIENSSSEEDYLTLKEYVGDYGLVTHKRQGLSKKLYGEKYFRYTDKDRAVNDPEQKGRMFGNSIPKKRLKKKPK